MTGGLLAASQDGKIALDLELVYGHCWGAQTGARDTAVRIAADRIPLRKRDNT